MSIGNRLAQNGPPAGVAIGGKPEIRLPRIGEVVDTQWALALCRHFGLEHLVVRIEKNPEHYSPWKFDGCSCLPDELLGLFTGCKWEDITYKCCLPHDLEYAYGRPGDVVQRRLVDHKFKMDLVIRAGMVSWLADVFHAAVQIGGAERFGASFSWGFASNPHQEVFA